MTNRNFSFLLRTQSSRKRWTKKKKLILPELDSNIRINENFINFLNDDDFIYFWINENLINFLKLITTSLNLIEKKKMNFCRNQTVCLTFRKSCWARTLLIPLQRCTMQKNISTTREHRFLCINTTSLWLLRGKVFFLKRKSSDEFFDFVKMEIRFEGLAREFYFSVYLIIKT